MCRKTALSGKAPLARFTKLILVQCLQNVQSLVQIIVFFFQNEQIASKFLTKRKTMFWRSWMYSRSQVFGYCRSKAGRSNVDSIKRFIPGRSMSTL